MYPVVVERAFGTYNGHILHEKPSACLEAFQPDIINFIRTEELAAHILCTQVSLHMVIP